MEYRIPKDTATLFKTKGLQSKDIDNFALRLNRFVRIELDSKDEYNGVNLNPNIDKNRVDKYYDSLEVLPYEQDSIFVKNDWKLTLGMGSGSVYNTSMTLHHIYGVPYLPAQSIKGAFRSYIIQSCFTDELFSEKYKEKYSKFEDEVLYKCDWFVKIFGSTNQQGQVMFFDAFSKDFKIVKDIMTPHYGKYYNQDKAPTDTQNPTPINFLAVEGASFEISFASKENYEIKEGEFKGKKVLEMIEEELTDSLEVFGIGGKTSVGYGYFETIKSEDEKEWKRIEKSINIKDFDKFIKSFSDSKYLNDAESKKKSLLQNKENEKKSEDNEKIKKVNEAVEKAWQNIHNPQYKSKLQSSLKQFIKTWSKKQKNKGSNLALSYVEKAKEESGLRSSK